MRHFEHAQQRRRNRAGECLLDNLYMWVMDRIEDWTDLPEKDEPSYLAWEILAACWELYDGHGDESHAREAIVAALAEAGATKSSASRP